MHMQTTERASVCPDRKGFGDSLTAAAAQLRGSPWIDFNNLATSTPSLVAEHLYEAVPRGIINMLCKMMIMNHTVNIELFNSDKKVFVSDSLALLVQEISSLVNGFIMDPCDLEDGFLPVVRAFGLSAQPLLESGKFFLGFDQESWVLNNRSIRQGGKTLKPDIYANPCFGEFMLVGFDANLATEDGEPLVGSVSLYCQGFYPALRGSVENNGHTAYPGNIKLLIRFELEPHLGIGYAPEPFLESGEADFDMFSGFLFLDPSEEILESLVEPVIKVLENLRKNNAGVSIKVFYAFIKVKLGQALACIFVCLNIDFKKLVIGFSANFKLFRKTANLLLARIQPEFVCF